MIENLPTLKLLDCLQNLYADPINIIVNCGKFEIDQANSF